ncbi:MAG: Esterase/lipase [uncultured Sphingomonas sp.]|uniref:Esterase/lipase n=1 Tax=uncultured Sphingomonas sp. TaxID=158754 RepID=A0A6J4TH04_9SPHN|nr:alpha/beta hydrolase [uncultured Sphingomonas sp.]CAA9523042.1 MAG: Esterase/lipase [uncultured Sphingomonas sp.]
MVKAVNKRTVLGIATAVSLGIGGAAFAQVPPPAAPAPQGQPGIPASGAPADPDNQAVLDALTRTLNIRPYHTLSPAEARRQPTFTDGVNAVLRANGRPTTPPPGTTERNITVRGAAGNLQALVIRPTGVRGPLPVILYFHGGGWVLANPAVYAGGARGLARNAGAMVISVNYRKAPENPFPAQHDDALASYRWLLQNAARLGGDPQRIAFAGESAGGNLAVATAMLARDAQLPLPRHILSVYPIAGSDLNTPSYQDSSNALPLSRATMAWFFRYVPRTPADLMDPRINLVGANLAGLPPVTIVAAQIDPLRSEGELLAQRLQAAGVQVERREFAGATHEFFGADAVIADAAEAQQYAGGRLRAALGSEVSATGGVPAAETGPASIPTPPPPENPRAGERG